MSPLHRLLRLRHLFTTTTPPKTLTLIPQIRTLAFSSAEEAAAERRRRKRRLRMDPPLHALRRDPTAPRPPPDPKAALLPDSTSALVGPRLNLHNRVQSLIRAGDLNSASAIARQAVFSSIRPTVFTCNAIMAAMYRAGRYDDSIALFYYFFKQSNINPNVVSYNVRINACCDKGDVDGAMGVYKELLENAPFTPSSVTFRHLTKGMVEAERIAEGVDLLREMLNKGLGADSLVYNNLIKGFLELGELEKANELFDELKGRCLVYDGVVSATFMDWWFKQGKEKEAMEAYRYLLDRQFRMTPATCNVLLEVLIRYGRKKEAQELFETMLDNHTPPTVQAVNSETFSIMVNECFRLGKYEEAVETFRKVGTKVNSKAFAMDVAGYTNIIVKFAEHEMISEAEKFFAELCGKSLSPDVTGYRTLIDAYLKEQRVDDAVQMFVRMVDANLRVLPAYANKWFGELIPNGKVVECAEILTKMGERETKPDTTTYEIVVKGLCEAGNIDAAKNTISEAMKYGVGVTPTFRKFLQETFSKEGQGDEIHRLLDPRKLGSGLYSQPPRPRPDLPAFLRPTLGPAGPNPFNPQQNSVPPASTAGPAGPSQSGTPQFHQASGPTGSSLPYSPNPLQNSAPPAFSTGPAGPYQSSPPQFPQANGPSGPSSPYHSSPQQKSAPSAFITGLAGTYQPDPPQFPQANGPTGPSSPYHSDPQQNSAPPAFATGPYQSGPPQFPQTNGPTGPSSPYHSDPQQNRAPPEFTTGPVGSYQYDSPRFPQASRPTGPSFPYHANLQQNSVPPAFTTGPAGHYQSGPPQSSQASELVGHQEPYHSGSNANYANPEAGFTGNPYPAAGYGMNLQAGTENYSHHGHGPGIWATYDAKRPGNR
ncbi:hypothetical protein Droror1_Dr00014061 [Drosera rotundifolia]